MTGPIRSAMCAALAAGLVLGVLAEEALAQDDIAVGDPEEGPSSASKKIEGLETEFKIRSEFHAFDNLDLRALDESSDQGIIDSDDAHNFAYSSISARIGYGINTQLRADVGLSHNGLWAEDQLGTQAELSGALNFFHLAFTYTAVQSDDLTLSFEIGRQPFKIGGVPRDYILDDNLDAVVIKADLGMAGAVRILALDYFTANDLPDAAFVRYVSGRESVLGLRGDTYSLRTGLVYENTDKIVEGLDLRVYGFFADIGGGPITETGADISFGGALGNFSDNDFTSVFGGRLSYTMGFGEHGSKLRIYGEGAHSQGIDRKEVTARDVEIGGNAFGGGLTLALKTESVGVSLAADAYFFDGPNYGSDGLQFEHGFVGFKGRRVGGLALDRYAGWYPSAHTSSGGFTDTPHETNRASGTFFIHAGAGLEVVETGTELRFDAWLLTDNGSTFLDPAAIDDLDPPFGHSREEYEAEARLGTSLGTEFDVQLIQTLAEQMEAYVVLGVFLPGEFYELEINKVAGSAQGSPDPQTFWAVTGGASVTF